MNNYKQAIETLQKVAKENKVANDVFHVFGQRKRARYQVTIHGLTQKMKAAGYTHKASDFESVLQLLANLGFGTLQKDAKGRIKALKEVKVTLQSIGKAAIQGEEIARFKKRNKYTKLIRDDKNTISKPKVLEQKEETMVVGLPVSLTVQMNGKPFNVSLPKGLTTDELAALIRKFEGSRKSA